MPNRTHSNTPSTKIHEFFLRLTQLNDVTRAIRDVSLLRDYNISNCDVMSDATSSPISIGELPTAGRRFAGVSSPHGEAAGPNADMLSEQLTCIDGKFEVNEMVVMFFLDVEFSQTSVSEAPSHGLPGVSLELSFVRSHCVVQAEALTGHLLVCVQD